MYQDNIKSFYLSKLEIYLILLLLNECKYLKSVLILKFEKKTVKNLNYNWKLRESDCADNTNRLQLNNSDLKILINSSVNMHRFKHVK